MWDIFISHASEDKASVVVPLVDQLAKHGLKVWVDYKELVAADSLLQRIQEGLAKSRFGLVVLSQGFFDKPWPNRELKGLFALGKDIDGRLLPIWHDVSSVDVSSKAPILADLVAIKTDVGIQRVAREVIKAIRRRDAPSGIDEVVESFVAAYDETLDQDDGLRVPKKIAIRDAIMKLAPKMRNADRYFGHPTEGGRLAFVAIHRQIPRRGQLFRLIETVRCTKHRFVWIEACYAIERYVDTCRLTTRERAQALAEIKALQHRPLYRRSAAVRKATEHARNFVEHNIAVASK